METMEYTAQTAVRPLRPTAKKARKVKEEIPLTPESELMSVEEYFDMVWKSYLEKYEKLHS